MRTTITVRARSHQLGPKPHCRRRGAGLPGATMMGPPPIQSADADEDAASLHAQISALKVMRRRLKAFRRRKRQRVEEPEDDVSMITAETVKETLSLYSAARLEDRLPPRLLLPPRITPYYPHGRSGRSASGLCSRAM